MGRFSLKKERSVLRISLDKKLLPLFEKLNPGIVLDVGSENTPYKGKIPYVKYMTLDINPQKGADIIADIHNVPWESEYFDTIIATELLEHCYSPERAVEEIHRLLKKGGICIASTPFICPYHPNPHDYYRFTHEGLDYLFRIFEKLEIYPYGNQIQSVWMLLKKPSIFRFLNILNPIISKVEFKDTNRPCGFIVLAKK